MSWHSKLAPAKVSLKEKRVLKRCVWGTILENGAFFDKKRHYFGAPGAPKQSSAT